MQRSHRDAEGLFQIVKPELQAGFADTVPATVALLFRLMTDGMLPVPSPRRWVPPNHRVEDDYRADFLGHGDLLLCHHIKTILRMYNPQKHYGRIVPIVQSSGSGKSRTVDQTLKKTHLGVQLCFRKESQTAVPPRDAVLADILCRPEHIPNGHPTDSRLRDRLCVLACFEALARCLAKEISFLCESFTATAAGPSLAGRFYEHLHAELVSSPSVDAGRTRPAGRCRRQELLETIAAQCKETCDSFARSTSDELKHFENTACAQAFLSLQASVSRAVESGQMHKDGAFVLALDEATGLGYLLGDIRRLWQAMGEKIVGEANRLVMLLLDTNSNVSHLAGQEALVKSDRLENKELKLLPVFTKLPYDVAYNALSREEQNPDGKTWGTLLKQLPRMGRPLLNNQHLKYVTDEESGYEALRPFVGEVSLFKVQAKLLTDKEPALKLPSVIAEPETSAKLQDPAEVYQVALDRYLAALCSRLPLRFIGLQGTVDLDQFLQRQVSSHLRTISDVNTTTNFISTGTPSEPLLSIAAADLFRKPRKNQSDTTSKRWEEAIFAIRFARKFYGLTAGEDGEEVMRLLLMMATDLAAYQSLVDAASEGQGSTDREVMDHWERGATLEPISLWDWLGELFGATNMAAATTKPDVKRRRSPGTSAGSGIEPKDRLEAFARSARINFTHFAPLPESIAAVTKEEVASWFVSHVALCGVPMQASWDMLIPVYVDPDWNGEQTLIDVSKFSYVVIQVKNRLASVPRGKTEIVPPVMLAHPRVPARAGSTRRGETAAASSSRSAARPFASAPRGKACAPPAQFEYLSLFVELQPAFETEAQGLRYTYDEGSARGSVAHKLHAIGLENAFGALLKKMQEGLVDLICTLIGADRNEVKEELNWETECKTICDYQKSLYTRKVKPVTATTSTANH